jgi:Fe-S-cluster containining protein
LEPIVTPSELCQYCRLCCDGSLFASVPVDAREAAELAKRGVATETRADGRVVLLQSCAALEPGGCRIYPDRPQTCRKFDCRLQVAVREGEVSAEEATERVDRARSLIAEVGQALPEVRRRAGRGEPLPEPAREALGRAETFLDRHFRGTALKGG